MSHMIREYQEAWDGLSRAERSVYVIEYQQLRTWLSHFTGECDPVIPWPWTDDEVFDSMQGYWYGDEYMKSTKGMLSLVDSKLITAARMAERSSRRSTKSSAPAKRP